MAGKPIHGPVPTLAANGKHVGLAEPYIVHVNPLHTVLLHLEPATHTDRSLVVNEQITAEQFDLVPLTALVDAVVRRCDAVLLEMAFKENTGRTKQAYRISGDGIVCRALALSMLDRVMRHARADEG
jgi:hypothetical protein